MADDVEIEEEMLDGLERLVALTGELQASRLPSVETTHRVVGTDVCHYSAPASMPEDPAQPSGRLLLTGTRAVFIGGAKLTARALARGGAGRCTASAICCSSAPTAARPTASAATATPTRCAAPRSRVI